MWGKVVLGRRWAQPHRPRRHPRRQRSPPQPRPAAHLRPATSSSRRALLPSPLTSRLLRPSRLQRGSSQPGGPGRGRWSWRAQQARWGTAADGRHVTWERLCRGGAGRRRTGRITISNAKAHPPQPRPAAAHHPHLRPATSSSRRALLPSPLTSPSRLQRGSSQPGGPGRGRWSRRAQQAR